MTEKIINTLAARAKLLESLNARETFDLLWVEASLEGHVDSIGGSEYRQALEREFITDDEEEE